MYALFFHQTANTGIVTQRWIRARTFLQQQQTQVVTQRWIRARNIPSVAAKTGSHKEMDQSQEHSFNSSKHRVVIQRWIRARNIPSAAANTE
jgi:hypothetical protein